VKLKSDAKLENFFNSWNMVMAGIKETPPDGILRTLFHDQIKGSSILSDDMSHYRRLEDGHPEKTYKWLWKTVNDYINRKREDENIEALKKSLAGDGGTAMPGKKGSPGNKKGGPPAKAKHELPCFKERDAGQCFKKDCPYKHNKPHGPAAATPSKPTGKHKAKTKTRAPSPKPKGPCHFFKKGKCKNGNNCPFSHDKAAPGPADPPPLKGPPAKKKKKGKAAGAAVAEDGGDGDDNQ